MISWGDFQQAMKEVCLLTGQNPPKEQMQAIYNKIKDSHLQDFLNACVDDQFLEDWSYKVNYPSLKKAIERYASIRREAEAREALKREAEELRRAIQGEALPPEVRAFLQNMRSS